MLHLRPTFGHVLNPGSSRLGSYWLHKATANLYRINDTLQDAQLERTSGSDPYRISSDFPGNGGIVSSGGFFRIQAS